MKSVIALAILCLTTIGAVQAQKIENTTVQKTEQKTQIDILAKQLGLTVAQKANVEKTMTSFNQLVTRINDSELSAADKAKKINSINARMEGNLKTYLTEEQFSKYEKIKSERKEF